MDKHANAKRERVPKALKADARSREPLAEFVSVHESSI